MASTETPLVSIVIPTKNAEPFLGACLRSIADQTYPRIEVLVIDGYSTDNTVAIAQAHCANVHSYKPALPAGMFDSPHKRNYGVKKASGTFVYYVDADMELGRNVVREAVELCQGGYDAAIVAEDSFGTGIWARAKNLERRCYWGDDTVEAPRFFWKYVWERVGGLDENVGGNDDWDLYRKLIDNRCKVGRIQSVARHNEGDLKLSKLFKKRFMYGRDATKYISKRPAAAIASFFPMRKGFLKNWRLFVSRPHDAVAVVIMRTVEYSGGFAGIVYSLLKESPPRPGSGDDADGGLSGNGDQHDRIPDRTARDRKALERSVSPGGNRAHVSLRDNSLPVPGGEQVLVGEPIVSVVIPLHNVSDRSRACLERCLSSLRQQTYQHFDITVVASSINAECEEICSRWQATLVSETGGKSAARNRGTALSRGRYILHLDSDMALEPDVIAQCVKTAEADNLDAVVIHEHLHSARIFCSARRMEKRIYVEDATIESPRFVRRSTLDRIGGFDVRLDPIDEGDIKEKLVAIRARVSQVSSMILVLNDHSLYQHLRAKVERGKKARLFTALHPSSVQFRPSRRVHAYWRSARLLAAHPLAGVQLVLLKALDLAAFNYGKLHSSSGDRLLVAELKNRDVFEREAASYQRMFYENSTGSRHVDREEKMIVTNLLQDIDGDTPMNILDLGAGGGRWSVLMLNRFPRAHVHACDMSEKMVTRIRRQCAKYDDRFSAHIADMQNLPFEDGLFDIIIGFRSLKYASDQQRVFSEIQRVAANGATVIVELPHDNIVLYLVRKIGIFGALHDYANRIRITSIEQIVHDLETAGHTIVAIKICFTVPATLYKKINNSILLAILRTLDRCLPKRLLGRSVVIRSSITKTEAIIHTTGAEAGQAEDRLQNRTASLHLHSRAAMAGEETHHIEGASNVSEGAAEVRRLT